VFSSPSIENPFYDLIIKAYEDIEKPPLFLSGRLNGYDRKTNRFFFTIGYDNDAQDFLILPEDFYDVLISIIEKLSTSMYVSKSLKYFLVQKRHNRILPATSNTDLENSILFRNLYGMAHEDVDVFNIDVKRVLEELKKAENLFDIDNISLFETTLDKDLLSRIPKNQPGSSNRFLDTTFDVTKTKCVEPVLFNPHPMKYNVYKDVSGDTNGVVYLDLYLPMEFNPYNQNFYNSTKDYEDQADDFSHELDVSEELLPLKVFFGENFTLFGARSLHPDDYLELVNTISFGIISSNCTFSSQHQQWNMKITAAFPYENTKKVIEALSALFYESSLKDGMINTSSQLSFDKIVFSLLTKKFIAIRKNFVEDKSGFASYDARTYLSSLSTNNSFFDGLSRFGSLGQQLESIEKEYDSYKNSIGSFFKQLADVVLYQNRIDIGSRYHIRCSNDDHFKSVMHYLDEYGISPVDVSIGDTTTFKEDVQSYVPLYKESKTRPYLRSTYKPYFESKDKSLVYTVCFCTSEKMSVHESIYFYYLSSFLQHFFYNHPLIRKHYESTPKKGVSLPEIHSVFTFDDETFSINVTGVDSLSNINTIILDCLKKIVEHQGLASELISKLYLYHAVIEFDRDVDSNCTNVEILSDYPQLRQKLIDINVSNLKSIVETILIDSGGINSTDYLNHDYPLKNIVVYGSSDLPKEIKNKRSSWFVEGTDKYSKEDIDLISSYSKSNGLEKDILASNMGLDEEQQERREIERRQKMIKNINMDLDSEF